MKRSLALSALASAAMAAAARPADAQPALRPLALGITGRTASAWPVYVATAVGLWAANGLKPDIIVSGSSAAGAQQLTAGSLELCDVSSTQVIQAIIGGAPLVNVFDRSRSAPYLLIGKKGVTTLQQLKGKTLIVGGPNDVTKVFTDVMFESAKMNPADMDYVYAGGAAERYAALVSGAVDASILNAPFMFRATDAGYPVIADVYTYFPQFPFINYAVNANWAKTHADLLIAALKTYAQAVLWLYDPANHQKAVDILARETNSPADDAEKTYGLYVTKLKFFTVNGTTTVEKVKLAIDALLRTKQIAAAPANLSVFYDNQYVAAVNAQLKIR